ncbi:MAG: hypothetical protein COB98_08920, partial [Flavobacteriaceae bacterium]
QNNATVGQALVWTNDLDGNGTTGDTGWKATSVNITMIAETTDNIGNQLIIGDGSSDVDNAGTIIDFGTAIEVDPSNIYTIATDGITVSETGIYKVTYRVTVFMGTNQNNRTGSEYILLVGSTPQAGTYSSNYHRNRYVDRTTATMTKIINITGGDKISVRGYRYYGNADIRTKKGGSSLLIEKL